MFVTFESITIAADNIHEMAAFYTSVLGADLELREPVARMVLYEGKLGNMRFRIVSNELAGVTAEQNRQQFTFGIDDIDAAMERALMAGGSIVDLPFSIDGHIRGAVADPDGNTIEFLQRAPVRQSLRTLIFQAV